MIVSIDIKGNSGDESNLGRILRHNNVKRRRKKKRKRTRSNRSMIQVEKRIIKK